jgi:hypothetical protein
MLVAMVSSIAIDAKIVAEAVPQVIVVPVSPELRKAVAIPVTAPVV